jgi:hypothetical protein
MEFIFYIAIAVGLISLLTPSNWHWLMKALLWFLITGIAFLVGSTLGIGNALTP